MRSAIKLNEQIVRSWQTLVCEVRTIRTDGEVRKTGLRRSHALVIRVCRNRR